MKLAIIGHKGYIGSVLHKQAIKKNYYVLGIDSNLFYNAYIGNPLEIHKEYTLDIRDIRKEHLKDIDVVVHLANLSNDPLCNLNPELTYEINYNATIELAKTAKKAGVRKFVFASSSSVYGQSEKIFINEDYKTDPLSSYGEAKTMVEKDLKTLSSNTFYTYSLRFATAYGWSDCMRFDLLINNLVALALSEKKLIIKGSPKFRRPFVHIEDIARSILAIVELKSNQLNTSNIFNVGRNEDNYTIHDLVQIIIEESHYAREVTYEPSGVDKRSYWIDSNKLHSTIGDNIMTWDVRSGIIDLFRKYKQHNVTDNMFKSIQFNRMEQLKYLLDIGLVDSSLRKV